MTGHDSGLITLALVEADDAERERRRSQLREPYRTLLGHFRHEVGHYFWDRLVRDRNVDGEFAAMFGDFTRRLWPGPASLLRQRRAGGLAEQFRQRLCDRASVGGFRRDLGALPAHRRHHRDGERRSTCISIRASIRPAELETNVNFNPYRARNFQNVIDNWLPMAFAMNNINRCMGQSDFYPFVLSVRAIEKLAFVHELIHRVATVEAVKPPGAELPAVP